MNAPDDSQGQLTTDKAFARHSPLKPVLVACERIWGYSGASTVRVVDGVFLCPSCNQPTSAHIQAPEARDE